MADTNANTTPITGDPTLPYRESAGRERTQDSILDWRGVQKRIPAHVVLKDYNEQKPLLPMVGQADVDRKRGFGIFFEYGDNFDTPAAGSALAKKRAERFLTDQLTLFGTTDSPRFHVGHSFELSEHFDEAQNRKVPHHGHRALLRPAALGRRQRRRQRSHRVSRDVRGHSSRRAISARAEDAEWPSIHGLMHGHIESDTTGKFSTLDAQGRYKVRFPFDGAGKTGDAASTWVRLAQPYAGSGYGSHHPLHKGTEVILAFYDGDPDRPVILGTVPNPLTASPSAGANATHSRSSRRIRVSR